MFKNIKVGDKVFCQQTLYLDEFTRRYEFRTYWVGCKVLNVTPARFSVDFSIIPDLHFKTPQVYQRVNGKVYSAQQGMPDEVYSLSEIPQDETIDYFDDIVYLKICSELLKLLDYDVKKQLEPARFHDKHFIQQLYVNLKQIIK